MWPAIHIYTKESTRNKNSSTLEPDRPQHDRTASCVIAQQYSSAAFVSLRFRSSKEKAGVHLKNAVISIFHFLIVCLKLWNLKAR
jgi:hypothetical protein